MSLLLTLAWAGTASVRAAAVREDAAPAAAQGTFERVLQAPDDVDANLAYAREQVQRGDLRAAATALERVLTASPDSHAVRLYYAGILLKMDLVDDARFQAEILRPQSLDAGQRAELVRIESELDRRRRKFRVSAAASTTFEHDSNRNASPESGQRLFMGAPVSVPASGRKAADSAFIGLLGLQASREFGRRKSQAFVSLDYLYTEQDVLDRLDLQAYSLGYGARLKTRRVEFTPAGFLHHVLLDGQTFLRIYGGGLTLQSQLTPDLALSVEGRGSYHQYNRIAGIAAAPERSGRRADVLARLSYTVTPSLLVRLDYGWARQEADKLYNAHASNAAGLSGYWLLPKGLFLAGLYSYTRTTYDREDPLISLRVRRDDSYRWRGTFGVPLSVFSRGLRNLVLSQGFEYQVSNSNLKNFEFRDRKLSTTLSYQWGI